ncbi:MAG: hypothetical protein L0216_21485 [Planctomycetales bacterium]|nr:hypothetical protein [Planctomycetales bacterium]
MVRASPTLVALALLSGAAAAQEPRAKPPPAPGQEAPPPPTPVRAPLTEEERARERLAPEKTAPIRRETLQDTVGPLPFIVQPRALAYLTVKPHLQLSRAGVRGTEIDADADLGLDNYEVSSPAVNFEVRTDLGGLRNTVLFSYRDSSYRGARALKGPITYDKTTFPGGTVVATTIEVRFLEARVEQRVFGGGEGSALEGWVTFGGIYAAVGTVLKAPGGVFDSAGAPQLSREVDTQETALPLLGGRIEWEWTGWLSVYAEGDALTFRTSNTRSTFLRAAAGFEVRLGRGWGFTLDYAASWLEIVKGAEDRDETGLLALGPRLSLVAEL